MSLPITSILRKILKVIIGIFLTYAVLFSLAGTAAIFYGFFVIAKPVRDVMQLKTRNPAETAFMKIHRENLRSEGKPDSITLIFVTLDSISLSLQKAALAAEDHGFYLHPGFDLKAILEAFEYNQSFSKTKKGASTITQQLAKNLFLSGDKTFSRKYKELMYAVMLEYFLDKNRILELYLNYAQWGENIFGCEAAARKYFKKPSSKITMEDAIPMVAVLVSPTKLSPLHPGSALMQKRIAMISNNLYFRPPPSDSTRDENGLFTSDSSQSSQDLDGVREFWQTPDTAIAPFSHNPTSAPNPTSGSSSSSR